MVLPKIRVLQNFTRIAVSILIAIVCVSKSSFFSTWASQDLDLFAKSL